VSCRASELLLLVGACGGEQCGGHAEAEEAADTSGAGDVSLESIPSQGAPGGDVTLGAAVADAAPLARSDAAAAPAAAAAEMAVVTAPEACGAELDLAAAPLTAQAVATPLAALEPPAAAQPQAADSAVDASGAPAEAGAALADSAAEAAAVRDLAPCAGEVRVSLKLSGFSPTVTRMKRKTPSPAAQPAATSAQPPIAERRGAVGKEACSREDARAKAKGPQPQHKPPPPAVNARATRSPPSSVPRALGPHTHVHVLRRAGEPHPDAPRFYKPKAR
jgi:hypothetical protein